jgi:hypothetical protein
MATRPLLEARIEDLRRIAEMSWRDPVRLEAVRAELARRDCRAAAALAAVLAARTAALAAAARGTDTPPAGDGGELAALRARVAALEAERDAAVHRAEAAERRGRAGTAAGDDYRAVGLDPGAPGYLLGAARRAHARALHPDGSAGLGAAERRNRERRLQEVNAALDRIARRRGTGSAA